MLDKDEDGEGTTRSLNGVDVGGFHDSKGWRGLGFSYIRDFLFSDDSPCNAIQYVVGQPLKFS